MLFDLFITFAKIGVMTFGGGYAMLPILQRELVENKGWTTEEDIADYCYCNKCGSTRIETTSIFEWERMYENRYGFKFLENKL